MSTGANNQSVHGQSKNMLESMKSNRSELRTIIDEQFEYVGLLGDFTSLLLSNRQYKRAEELLVIISKLYSTTTQLEQVATSIDEELAR